MVRIFPDCIRIRSGLEEFLSVCIHFRVFNIRNQSVFEYSKVTFLWCWHSLQSYPAKTSTIRIWLCIRIKIWKQIRYQYYSSVSDLSGGFSGGGQVLVLVRLACVLHRWRWCGEPNIGARSRVFPSVFVGRGGGLGGGDGCLSPAMDLLLEYH